MFVPSRIPPFTTRLTAIVLSTSSSLSVSLEFGSYIFLMLCCNSSEKVSAPVSTSVPAIVLSARSPPFVWATLLINFSPQPPCPLAWNAAPESAFSAKSTLPATSPYASELPIPFPASTASLEVFLIISSQHLSHNF